MVDATSATSGTSNILSRVNQGGSGLDIPSIVKAIVDAETVPERSTVEGQLEETNLSISAMGQLSSQVSNFDAALGTLRDTGSRTAVSGNAALSIAVSNEKAAEDFSAAIRVNQLAQGQVLAVSLGNVTASSAVGTGDLTLEFGRWAEGYADADTSGNADFTPSARTSETITIAAGNNTVAGLVAGFNAIEGVAASLVDTGSGLALIIKTDPGAENALRITSTGAGGSLLGRVAFDPADQAAAEAAINATALVATQSAQDAVLTVDGVSVTRESNTIDDLFAGHTIGLNATTSSAFAVASVETAASAKSRMDALLESINSVKSYLNEATRRGINGAEPGPLAGDLTAQSIERQLRAITTSPVGGFGDDPVYLAQLGVRTERDGTLSLDEDAFNAAIAANPAVIDALFTTGYGASVPGLNVSGLSFSPPKPGNYALSYSQSAGTATLDGVAMTVSTNAANQKVLRVPSGDAAGLTVTLDADVDVTATVRYGRSLLDTLADYTKTLLGNSGTIATRERELGEDVREFEDRITDIDDKVAMLTERYNTQFARMEALVTSLNKTGEYMQTLMDAWSKDN